MKTNNKGFEIAFNIQSKILHIRAWGAWDAKLLNKYIAALRNKITSGGSASALPSWRIWYVLVDLSECSTFMLETFRETQMSLLQEVGKLELKKIAYLENGIRLQRHALVPTPLHNGAQQLFFTSREDALQWLWSESAQ
jgi:hypothetical protein